MRRYKAPYNGNQYVLNKSTGEIHDLDNETSQCQIDEIKPEHVLNCTTFENAILRAYLFDTPNPNGCYYCMRSMDNG